VSGSRGILELARLFGVETEYEDMNGERRRPEPHALALTLRALGAELDDERGVRHALRRRREELQAMTIQPAHVAWDGSLSQLQIRLDQAEAESAVVELRLESGEVVVQHGVAQPASPRPSRGWTPTHLLPLERRLPIGYHTIAIETRGTTLETRVIAAPRHAYVPDDVHGWGVFAPLYALCSSRSQGIGDFTDLRTLAEWTRALGGGFVSTLPLLASFLDAPFEPSPYSPASRLFWNELFIDLERVPGWSAGAALLCRTDELVDYRGIGAFKRRELARALIASLGDAALQHELRAFAESHPRVADYARFRAVSDRRREGWPAWPDRMRDGELRDGDFAPEDVEYHIFAQWVADRQLADLAAARDDGAAALYLDMPLGVNPDGYDVWRFRELFAEGVSAGAPPDPLFTGGQNWGFPPLNPRALRRTGYAYLIDTFRHHLRHARMLRLDHVMSLYRLFWVPQGLDAKDGVYVRYRDDELFAVLVLESARHRAVVIGEDLGTVPTAVRRAMDRHHVQRMHVVQFEASPENRPPVPLPPDNVVASLNTHDMPTFAGFWRGNEIDDQLDLGLIDAVEHEQAHGRRSRLREALSRDLGAGGVIEAGLARQRLLERLAGSRARYVLINLEDLWLEDRPQNVPGTSAERPNWKRRASRPLDDIVADASLRRVLKSIAERRVALAIPMKSHG
jgi:4-alpha-glucanotransferase